MRQRYGAGLFQNIEYGNPILPGRFHADLKTGMFCKPVRQLPQSSGKGREASLFIFRSSVRVGDSDTGENPGLVYVESATVLAENLKSH